MARDTEKIKAAAIRKAADNGHAMGEWEDTGAAFGTIATARCSSCSLEVSLCATQHYDEAGGEALIESCPPAEGLEGRRQARKKQEWLEALQRRRDDAIQKIAEYSEIRDQCNQEIAKIEKE